MKKQTQQKLLVFPRKAVHFSAPFNQPIETNLKLVNAGQLPMAFKCLVTNNDLWMVGPPMGIIQPASELMLKVRVKQLLDAHGKMAVKPFDHKRQRLAILCVDLSQSEVHLMRESGVLKETLRAMKSAMSKRARLRLIFDDFKVLNEENTRETPENDAQPKASVLSLENPPATLSRDSEALDELQQSRIHIFVILHLLAMFAMNIFLS